MAKSKPLTDFYAYRGIESGITYFLVETYQFICTAPERVGYVLQLTEESERLFLSCYVATAEYLTQEIKDYTFLIGEEKTVALDKLELAYEHFGTLIYNGDDYPDLDEPDEEFPF